jgi:hypothetical protein
MPITGVSGCDSRRCNEIKIFGVLRSAACPVHRAGEGDLAVNNHRLCVSDSNAAIYPDRHSCLGQRGEARFAFAWRGSVRDDSNTPRRLAWISASTALEPVVRL